MRYIADFIKPEITTEELDKLVHDYIVSHNGIPASLNYQGFPKSCCISLNEEICHGIPDNRKLKEGDIVKVDIAVILDSYFGDMCKTFPVGEVSLEAKKLMLVTQNALLEAIKVVQPYKHIGDIGHFIHTFANALGYSVVVEFCGHGVGIEFHEPPQVPHIGIKGEGAKIVPGMIFTIEPMLCVGEPEMVILENKWTAITKDKKLTAQFEHTILVTKTGTETLTEF